MCTSEAPCYWGTLQLLIGIFARYAGTDCVRWPFGHQKVKLFNRGLLLFRENRPPFFPQPARYRRLSDEAEPSVNTSAFSFIAAFSVAEVKKVSGRNCRLRLKTTLSLIARLSPRHAMRVCYSHLSRKGLDEGMARIGRALRWVVSCFGSVSEMIYLSAALSTRSGGR